MSMSVRAYRAGDMDALFDLVNAATAPARTMTRRVLAEFLAFPRFRLETDLFVATADSDTSALVAARDVRMIARGDETVPLLESWGVALPTIDNDVRDALMCASLARASEILAERGRSRGTFQVRARADDTAARDFYAAFDILEARSLFTMERPNLDGLTEPQFPPGIAVKSYRNGTDDKAWVSAFNEAFSDHWGGFMGMSQEYWDRYTQQPTFNPSISLVAWDGTQLAGFCHCRIDEEMNALHGCRCGAIRYVGVRPGWRRIGLGVALTRAGLIALRDAGMTTVALGVDAENVTGAHHIYAHLGFVVTGQQTMYRKSIP
ncbi:MAG: GNAT family N-acetyltransferase [Thermomicrobia bacterium]|nr:GNAT family N-acetyltransferase [Thermomicrobia bacterium]